jgi:hypothetical protein
MDESVERPEEQPDAGPGEQPTAPEHADVDGSPEPDRSAEAATAHPAVDEVLRSLERLADVPVDEHVAAFEQAHDQLRRALAEARDPDDARGAPADARDTGR